MGIEGEDDSRVMDGISVLRDINFGKKVDLKGDIAVVGGGNVAIDVARTALRIGALSVTLLYRRSRKEMPAHEMEISDAIDEGVDPKYLTNPVKITANEDGLSVECVKMQLGEPDSSGRCKVSAIEGSEFVVDCDTLVFATGQHPDVKQLAENAGLQLLPNGRFQYDEVTNMTSRDGVFVAGGVMDAQSNVVGSMASGRKAALAIDNYIQDRSIEDRTVKHNLAVAAQKEMIYRIHLEDSAPQEMPKQKFRDNFDLVELGFNDVQAHEESIRCMMCGFSMVDEDQCIGCGACVSVCPENCITLVKN